MPTLSKKGWLTLLFVLFVVVEILFFLYDAIEAFDTRSKKDIAHLITSKKNATMSMAITAAHLVGSCSFSETTLKRLSLDLARHTKFKNIWFKIIERTGRIVWSNIPVRNADVYRQLLSKKEYFSGFVVDCKGIHIASFAPIDTEGFRGYFGVISQFNSIQKELEKEGVESITVVDRAFGNLAFGIYEEIAGYKIVNIAPKRDFLKLLRDVDIERLLQRDFLIKRGYLIGRYPLRTGDGEIVGWIFYAKSFKNIVLDIFYKKVFGYVGLFFALLILYLFLLLRLFYEEQRKVGQYYKKILERLGEIVFITDGEGVFYANRKFIEYFGNEKECVCRFFVEEDGFLKRSEWRGFLKEQKERRAKVRIGNQEYIFLIRSTTIAKREYSIVMIDITRQYYYEKSLEVKALKDPLTGLYNRYMLIQTFLRFKEESRLERSEIVVVLFDIDHFKKINDTYGHDRGDLVLKELARVLRGFFRSEDMLFRIGGEEFLLLLKTKDIAKILQQLQRLKEEVAKHDFGGIRLTISMGVAKWCGESFEKLFKRADEALYRSKEGGRNKITYEGECDDK